MEDSGYYICEVRRSSNGLTKKSKEINVQIQELFSHPEIVANTDFPREGIRVILTCNTSINTLRNDIELQFAFYQNEKKVQKLNSSHQYIIPLAQLEDSGNYSCEARNLYNGMKKRSAVVSVVIQGTSSTYLLIICSETPLLLILAILGFLYMFRQRRSSVNNQDPMTGAAAKPVVTFTPNVNKIFEGENIVMTCNVESILQGDAAYYWYRDGEWVQTRRIATISSAEMRDGGEYHCWTKYTKGSDALRLDVSNDWVILQAPYYVHEGDNITLRCRHLPQYDAGQTIFYKDNVVVQDWSYIDEFLIGNMDVQKTGKYACTKQVLHYGMYHRHSDGASISVLELFLKPELTVTPDLVTDGDHMTLLCTTTLSWHRQRAELQFAFHKDGENVQTFSSSHQYEVQSAQLEDSGNYSCEVRAPTKSVKKRSRELYIHINEPLFYLLLKANSSELVEGDRMTLTCDIIPGSHRQTTELQFAFYRGGRNLQRFGLSDQYGVQSAQLEDSGNYYCEVITTVSSAKKRSKEVNIYIQEVFKKPNITVIPYPVMEGDEMTLMCVTSLSPLRQGTKLQFAFYRDGWIVQEFNLYDQYGVRSAQLEDSGNYSCEVKASSRLVKKSSVVFIQIKGQYSKVGNLWMLHSLTKFD
ncbi:Fc receptor-like protein 3 [Lithobates pipiens]